MQAVLNGPQGSVQLGSIPLTIGRAPDNQLIVNDGKASSHHAELRPMGQGHVIVDLGSTNGTFVNEEQVAANMPRMLVSGDTIRFGHTAYTYEMRGGSGQQPAPTMYAAQNQSGYAATQAAQSYQPTAYGGYQPTQQAQGYQPTQQAAYPGYNQNQPVGFPPANPYNPTQPAPFAPAPPPFSSQPPYNAGQAYNPIPPPYPSAAYPATTPGSAGNQKRSGLRTLLLLSLALIVIIGAASTFLVIHSSQVATENTQATSTATTRFNDAATATAQVFAAATATAQANPYGSGTLAFEDALKNNKGGHQWQEDSDCAFTNQTYQASISKQKTFASCFAQNTNFSNFTYEVQMTISSGDCGGVAFRGEASDAKGYLFEVCGDQSYAFLNYDGSSGKTLFDPTTSSAIKGIGQANKLAVVANNGSIQLYVNGTSLQTVQDSTYAGGSIGVLALDLQNATQVSFTEARVWQ